MADHDDEARDPFGRPAAPPGYTSRIPPGAGGPPAVRSADAVRERMVLSGWWRRAGALMVDSLIIGAGGLLLLVAITAPFSVGFFASDSAGAVSIAVGFLLAAVCVSLVALFYAPAMMARTNGRTLGRMVTGIRVVRANGQPITFGFAVVREVVVKTMLFGFVGSLTVGVVNVLDALWPLWDEENRALHDFVVNTRTVLV